MSGSFARLFLHTAMLVVTFDLGVQTLKVQHAMQPARTHYQKGSADAAGSAAGQTNTVINTQTEIYTNGQTQAASNGQIQTSTNGQMQASTKSRSRAYRSARSNVASHTSTYWSGKLAAQAVKNPGVDCFSHCGNKGGLCDWCGAGNACCRYDFLDAEECSRSTGFTSTDHHECVALEQEKPTLNWNMLERFILVPEHNLLFCYVEKVACRNFNDLFAGIRKSYDPKMIHTKKTTGWFQNSPFERGYTKEDIEGILVNRSWHKALFYRDPVERFVSAYRSKCEGADPDGRWVCAMTFGSPEASFPLAVHRLRESDQKRRTEKEEIEHEYKMNEHFMKQSSFCGGLMNSAQYYNTIESLEKDTAAKKVTKLLHDIGADPSWVDNFDELFPAGEPNDASLADISTKTREAASASATDAHNTNSLEHLRDYLPPNHPETLAALIQHYQDDYTLFNITAPSWQAKIAESVMQTGDFNIRRSSLSQAV